MTRPSEAEVEAAWKKAYADIGAGEVDFPPNQWARAFAAALSTPPLPSAPERDCTCLGSCKGAQGLAAGWRCALSKGAPPLPSAEPVAWLTDAEVDSMASLMWQQSDVGATFREVVREVERAIRSRCTTPPAAAQDTAQREVLRYRVAGQAIVGAWDAMDSVPADDPRPTQQLADEFAAKLMPMRTLLDAARAAGGE